VYENTIHQNKEQQNIALFWDCNPFAVQRIGHVEFGLKKISPGGHWIGITGIACKNLKRNCVLIDINANAKNIFDIRVKDTKEPMDTIEQNIISFENE
jgi:hypothetical protein